MCDKIDVENLLIVRILQSDGDDDDCGGGCVHNHDGDIISHSNEAIKIASKFSVYLTISY